MAIVTSLLVLTLVIIVHELGHYLAFKACKIEIIRFSVGFGPVIFRRWWKGTEWCLSAIPFGGYVIPASSAALGSFLRNEDTERIRSERPCLFEPSRWLENASPARKIVGSIAGPVANLVAAFVICLWIAASTESVPLRGKVTVTKVEPDSIASAMHLEPGDILLRVNGSEISLPAEGKVAMELALLLEERITTQVQRGKAPGVIECVFQQTKEQRENLPDLGLTLAPEGWEAQSIGNTIMDAFHQTKRTLCLTFDLLTELPAATVASQLSGPIGIVHAGAVGQKQGDGFLLIFFLALNVGVCVFNLIPFPGLDGSHIVLALIQWIRGKQLPARLERAYNTTAALMIISLFLVLMVKDIWSLFS